MQGVLITAAEQGYITELACQMPECLRPEELGGRGYFEPVTDDLPDWMPTHEPFPRSKEKGGQSITRFWRIVFATESITRRASGDHMRATPGSRQRDFERSSARGIGAVPEACEHGHPW